MKLHKEGNRILITSLGIFAAILIIIKLLIPTCSIVFYISSAILLVLYILIVRFFRMPNRTMLIDNNKIICPCDGKVVVIEETEEPEYFQDKRLQISVFMSPNNVHVNRYSVNGIL